MIHPIRPANPAHPVGPAGPIGIVTAIDRTGDYDTLVDAEHTGTATVFGESTGGDGAARTDQNTDADTDDQHTTDDEGSGFGVVAVIEALLAAAVFDTGRRRR